MYVFSVSKGLLLNHHILCTEMEERKTVNVYDCAEFFFSIVNVNSIMYIKHSVPACAV